MSSYNFQEVEKKWQSRWDQDQPAKAKNNLSGKKYYCLDMFPYPSGSGLHVGHWRGYTLSDIYARIKWLEGYNVLHPMGWDAFGLPAENDAIKKGIHPAIGTASNVANFKKQLKEIGAIYDWTKELSTTDPQFYKWTQWIFLQMYKAGLAYEANMPINWCPSCLTGVANEEVVENKCERCGTKVTEKQIRQWVLKITDYAEKLIDGLDTVDWPEKVKTMQRNWIGKSTGLLFTSPVKDSDLKLQSFSAHFEACYADNYVVIAPGHKLLPELIKNVQNKEEILEFAKKIVDKRKQSKHDNKEVEGIFTGKYIVDPLTGKDMPIWVASFAIADYGTGIIKCSAHDARDVAFAKKYNIPIIIGLVPKDPELRKQVENFEVCYTDMNEGLLVGPVPEQFKDRQSKEAREELIEYLVSKGLAERKVSYKLRDWIFSRQRYWGEPIPLVHCQKCGTVPVPEKDLPIILPDVKKYEPTGTGESPLAGIDEWVNTNCPTCSGPAKRETNTMPQWAGSCWYFLRYPNPNLEDKPFDQNDLDYWMPVDLYVGGIEHAILHLLYSRFYIKVLYDLGFLKFDEPFKQLFNQGMIVKLSEKTGLVEKMSKSKGNVVNPDDIIAKYGSDVLRLYILFMGPPELDAEWQDTGLEGIKRFLNKLEAYLSNPANIVTDVEESAEAKKRVHIFLDTFQNRLNHLKPNTAISAFMELANDLINKKLKIGKSSLEAILASLSVLAPHMASELLENLLNKKVEDCTWPTFDPALTKQEEVTLAIQVNGKMRGTITAPIGCKQEDVESLAKEIISKWLDGKEIRKVIFVPNRMISFVVN
jgi:leucyl-tRNA synthetase